MATGYSILYIDDDTTLLEIAKMFLEKSEDFTVTTAISAAEGLRLLEGGTFDAIISDYQMPQTNGIEFLKIVRETYGNIPFILFTGKGREEIVIQALNEGANFYLQKGGDPRSQFAELSHKIRTAVKYKRLDESTRKTNEHLQLAQKLNQSGSWELDLATGTIWGSKEAFRIFEIPRPDDGLLTLEDVEARIPERERVHRALTDLVESGKEYNLEYAIEQADKSGQKFVHSVARIYCDTRNKSTKVIGVIQDITERKRAEIALHESKHHLDAMAANIPGVVYRIYVNPDGTYGINYISERSRQILGLENDPATIFEQIKTGIIPEDRERFISSIWHAINTKMLWEFEGWFVKPSGEKIWIHGISNPVMENDRIIFDGVIFDHTRLKLAEEALFEREERFRLLTTGSSDVIGILDPTGKFTYLSDNVVGFTGDQPDEYKGKSALEFVHPEDKNKVGATMARLLGNNEKHVVVEFRVRQQEGGWVWVEAIGTNQLASPVINGIVVNMRDITERKATEEALKKSESRINSILRAAPVGIGVTSERVIQTVNKRLTEILGYPEEELLGRSSRFVYATQEDFDRVSREFRAHVKDPWGSVVEVQWKKKDDSIIDVLLSSVPVDSSDISKGVTFTALDITDRKRAGIALDKARNKMNVLRKITNEDIHNAVFSLSAYLHLMNPDKADGNVQEYIEKQVPLLQDIFESLNFAKEYQDMGIKPPRWQQVIGVFTYAVSHLNFLDINRKVSLDNLEIFADPMLEKAFFHLMQNSITHGVRVTEVCLSYQETKEGIRLIIEDNGVGIPDDKKKEIFQRGYRKSSGHGLFLVREILSITGMTITETGEPGKGARFEIMVPKGAYRRCPR